MEDIANKFWAIGGGKGGVGKSVVTVMLGTALARLGKKVVLVDADLGGSNLHTLVGIRYPRYTLVDFLKKNVLSMDDVLLDTPVENMKIICGADDILGVANPKHAQKIKIFNHLRNVNADVILIDLGGGVSFTTIDFFLFAPNKIVVLTPQVTSIQNAYGFIKSSLYRKLSFEFSKDPEILELITRASFSTQGESIDSMAKLHEAIKALDCEAAEKLMDILNHFDIHLVVNMLRDTKEKNISNIVKSVAKNYLGLEIEELGIINYDSLLGMSINNMPSFIKSNKDSASKYNFYSLAQNVSRKQQVLMTESTLPPVFAAPAGASALESA
jgi:flagellar biosynthesis protein FlhG